jgi:hypothetical protein
MSNMGMPDARLEVELLQWWRRMNCLFAGNIETDRINAE